MPITFHGPDPRVGPKCDLCLVGSPSWRHPVRVFHIRDIRGGICVLGVEGAVAACHPCSDDLVAGVHRLPDIETRAIEALGVFGQAHFPPLKAWLHNLHHGILANLVGERRPM